jgi:transcriptional regulator NrdR family protein
MTCPTCSSPARVIDSRADDGDGGVRRRRYQCWKCDTRFSTYEISAEEYEKVRAMKINTTQIDATIATLRAIKAQFGERNGAKVDQ